MNLALIAPTPAESKAIRCEMQPSPAEELKIIYEAELHGKPVTFTHCGVGKVNAAHSATLMLENYSIDLMILFGIAGAYSGARVGDVVIAEKESYGEEGVLTKEGWRSMEFLGFPFLKKEKEYYNTYEMDPECVQSSKDICMKAGIEIKSGNFVTVSQCSGTYEMGEILRKRFNGTCENMEGAAVAHICAIYGVPMIEIRGISNISEDRDIGKWNIKKAALKCNRAVIEIIKRLT